MISSRGSMVSSPGSSLLADSTSCTLTIASDAMWTVGGGGQSGNIITITLPVTSDGDVRVGGSGTVLFKRDVRWRTLSALSTTSSDSVTVSVMGLAADTKVLISEHVDMTGTGQSLVLDSCVATFPAASVVNLYALLAKSATITVCGRLCRSGAYGRSG